MKKVLDWLSIAVMSLILIIGGVSASAAKAPEDGFRWKMQCNLPSNSSAYQNVYKAFVDRVAEKSEGRLVIKDLPVNTIVPATEELEALEKGLFEVAGDVSLYHMGKYPEAPIISGLPACFTETDEFYDFAHRWRDGIYHKTLSKIFEELGVHLLCFGCTGEYGIMTRFPVSTLEDLKGKKMRTLGSLNPLFKALGATPVTLVQAELYTALQRKTVDGLVYVYYGLEDYKYKEVVDYVVFPPVYMIHGGHLTVNMKAWNKLPDDLKKIVEESCRWAWIENHDKKYKATVAEALKEAKKVGVKMVTLSEEDVAKMRTVARDIVWKQLAGKSPRCGDLVEMFESYLKEKGKW